MCKRCDDKAAQDQDISVMSWADIHKMIHGRALSIRAELAKVEICNLVRQTDNRLTDGDIGVLLIVIGESMLDGVEA